MPMSKAREALKEECRNGCWNYPYDKEKEIFDLIDKIESTHDLKDWKEWMISQFGANEDEEDDEVSYCVSSSGRRMDREVASNYF